VATVATYVSNTVNLRDKSINFITINATTKIRTSTSKKVNIFAFVGGEKIKKNHYHGYYFTLLSHICCDMLGGGNIIFDACGH
jgi:hypothetical protein